MSVQIGSVPLDEDMVWLDEYIWSLAHAEVTPTLGGGLVWQEFTATEKGRPITLATESGYGYQLKSTVEALKALAQVVGATYSLTIIQPGGAASITKTVRFRHELDGGPIQFTPAPWREGYVPSTAWYKGQIFLMVV